jgi:hypothetical protein
MQCLLKGLIPNRISRQMRRGERGTPEPAFNQLQVRITGATDSAYVHVDYQPVVSQLRFVSRDVRASPCACTLSPRAGRVAPGHLGSHGPKGRPRPSGTTGFPIGPSQVHERSEERRRTAGIRRTAESAEAEGCRDRRVKGQARRCREEAHGVIASDLGELLRAESVGDRKKKRQSKGRARALIAGIKREMQEPRLAKSVRDDPNYQAALVAKEPAR